MRKIILTLWVFTSITAVACVSLAKPRAAVSWTQVKRGVRYFRVGALKQAVDSLEPLVAQAPRKLSGPQATAAYVLARAYAGLGQGDEAAKMLHRAKPSIRGLHGASWSFAEIEVLLARGKQREAFTRLTRLRRKYPSFRWAQADLMWSRLYERQGPPEKAAQASLALLRKKKAYLHLPGDELVARAARLYQKANQADKARALWRRLLMQYPESALIDEALKVVPMKSLTDADRLRRAELLFKRRDYERCRAESLYLWNKGKHRDTVGYLLGKIGSERLRDDFEGPIKYYAAAMEPSAPYAMFALAGYATVLVKVKRYAEAIKAYDLWLKRYPNENIKRVNEVMYDRCRAIRGWGKPLRAAREYKVFLKEHRRGFDWKKYWWFVGFWSYLGGRYDDALAVFEDLVSSWNALVGGKARYWKGKALEKKGDTKQAAKVWLRLVQRMPLNYYSAMAEDQLRRLGHGAKLPRPKDLSKVPFRRLRPFKGLKKSASIRRLHATAQLGEWDTLREVLEEERNALTSQLGKERLTQLISELSDELEDFYTDRSRAYRTQRKHLRNYPRESNVNHWRAMYPRAYPSHVTYWSKKYGAPEWMVYAHMLQESRYKPWVISNAPAYGLLELLDRTARRLADEKGEDYQLWMLMQPSYNIRWGTQYLGALYRKFHQQLPFAICSYNAGPMLLEYILPREKGQDFDVLIDDINTHQARNYVRMVIGHFLRYLAIYETPDKAAEYRKQLLPKPWKAEWLKEPSY